MPKRAAIELKGSGVSGLRESLAETLPQWPLLEPLPVTRFLGQAFGISNVSAHRVLGGLADGGVVWRAPNGRYFRSEARRLLDRPNPLACLLRQFERWTEACRQMVQGADIVCGETDRGLLLLHDRVLFRQSDATAPALQGADSDLTSSLNDFCELHAERTRGVLLDELWPDRVLAGFRERLSGGVVLYRQTSNKFLGSVSTDVGSLARILMLHVHEQCYQRLVIVQPYPVYAPSLEAAEAITAHAKKRGLSTTNIFFETLSSTVSLLESERASAETLIVCTEDNNAVALLPLTTASIGKKRRQCAGLLSTMGTSMAIQAGITSISTDFRKIGEEAARMAIRQECGRLRLPPTFVRGKTS